MDVSSTSSPPGIIAGSTFELRFTPSETASIIASGSTVPTPIFVESTTLPIQQTSSTGLNPTPALLPGLSITAISPQTDVPPYLQPSTSPPAFLITASVGSNDEPPETVEEPSYPPFTVVTEVITIDPSDDNVPYQPPTAMPTFATSSASSLEDRDMFTSLSIPETSKILVDTSQLPLQTLLPVTSHQAAGPATSSNVVTTSRFVTTTSFTVTSCHSSESDCSIGHLTTKTITLYTTVGAVTLEPPHPTPPPGLTTSTVQTIITQTITSCHPTVKDCPVGNVVTDTIDVYTTICPIQPTPPPKPPRVIGVLVTIIIDITVEICEVNGVTGLYPSATSASQILTSQQKRISTRRCSQASPRVCTIKQQLISVSLY